MNKKTIEKLLPPGSRVLCAVSGGADSVCMLHMLYELRQELEIELFAAHYEHGLRGEEALRDAAFVEDCCKKLGICFKLGHGDVPAFAREKGMSIEEAARHLRYDFLQKTAAEFGCDRIATAHNADDNAETVLFNLSRGSGALGLRGIPERRGMIVRPLLHMSRGEIESWLSERGLAFVHDSSNDSDDYSRNLIRHRVMPALKSINPACTAAIASAGQLLAEDEDFIQSEARGFIDRHFDGESLPVAELKGLHRAVASRVFRMMSKKSLSREHVESLFALLEGSGLAYADLPGMRVCREQGRISFGQGEAAQPLPERELQPGDELYLPSAGLHIKAELGTFNKEINGLFKTYCFKYESICGIIKCTARKAGDKYRPAGRGCTKTLKSLYLESRMTQRQRDGYPVFRDEKGVVAAYPFPQAERTLPQKGDRVLYITIERETGES